MKNICKHSIVISIILLLIGVSVSSAISVDTKSTISNNQSEDCKECNEISYADLIHVERLLDRVEIYSKLLLVLSKHNPELKEISEDLSFRVSKIINNFKDLITKILLSDFELICDILALVYLFSIGLVASWGSLLRLFENNYLITVIISPFALASLHFFHFVSELYFTTFDCYYNYL